MVRIVLAVAVVVLFAMLGRELWRAFMAQARATGRRRADAFDAHSRIARAMHEPGATPGLPLEVTSASVVEPQATSLACVVCDARVIAQEHGVEMSGEEPLRVVTVHCRRCGHRRPIYVRIRSEVLH